MAARVRRVRPAGSARRRAGNPRDAFAGVLDHEAHGGRGALHAHGDAGARGVNLTAFETRFDDLPQAVGVAHTRPAPGSSNGPGRGLGGGGRHQRLDGGGGDGRELQRAHVQAELRPTIRDRSRMSEMTWACAAAFRSMASRPPAGGGLVEPASAQEIGPAHDRGQRRAQLVRQRGEELVLDPARRLRLRARALRVGQEARTLPVVLLALGDVAGKGAEAEIATVRDGGDGELEREDGAGRAPRLHLQPRVRVPFPRRQPGEEARERAALPLREDQLGQGMADRLLARDPERLLGPGVPERPEPGAVRVRQEARRG